MSEYIADMLVNFMHKVTFDQELKQFRVALEGDYSAIVKFEQQDNVFVITSTKIPNELQGKGYGKLMMEKVLPEIERMGVKVIPECSFVVAYFERNPQWQHLLVM